MAGSPTSRTSSPTIGLAFSTSNESGRDDNFALSEVSRLVRKSDAMLGPVPSKNVLGLGGDEVYLEHRGNDDHAPARKSKLFDKFWQKRMQSGLMTGGVYRDAQKHGLRWLKRLSSRSRSRSRGHSSPQTARSASPSMNAARDGVGASTPTSTGDLVASKFASREAKVALLEDSTATFGHNATSRDTTEEDGIGNSCSASASASGQLFTSLSETERASASASVSASG